MNIDKVTKKVKKILANIGIFKTEPDYDYLLKEGIAMRELGYSWNQIYNILEEKAEYSQMGF